MDRARVDKAVLEMWKALSELAGARYDLFTNEDAALFAEVTNHPAIQDRLRSKA